ncbi:MAG: hypothetical protein NXI21_08595 [Alphaproteobacteria bacterium]|nr:hypothetical protein [Alphaproteobacteria bacterium]
MEALLERLRAFDRELDGVGRGVGRGVLGPAWERTKASARPGRGALTPP